MNRKFHGFLASVTILVVAFVASIAHASGSFKLKANSVNEVSGGWHLFVDIALARPPSTPHMPMKFLFTKTMVFERALVDNSKDPVMNRQALSNQTPSIESLDVDFADPRGKIYNRTRFDFSLTRTRGYEAGEYKVQLRTSDGIDVGGAVNLTLNGENPVVDRRAMNFSAKDSSIKKVDNGVDGGGPAGPATDDSTPATASTDVVASGEAPPFIPPEAYQKTPEEEVKVKPHGCGCSLPGTGGSGNLLFVGAPIAGLLLVAARRKRGAVSRGLGSREL